MRNLALMWVLLGVVELTFYNQRIGGVPMKRGNTFILSGVWVFGLLLLIPYGSFAETQSDENYPDAIKCIVDKYVASFPKVNGPSRYKGPLNDNEHRRLLGPTFFQIPVKIDAVSHELTYKETYLGSLKVKSVEIFALGQNKNFDLGLEIWTMEKSIDINRFRFSDDDLYRYLPKEPWRIFVYDNIFVLFWARATMFDELLQEKACKLVQMCFDCGDIDNRFNGFVDREKRCGCGKAKEAEKEQK